MIIKKLKQAANWIPIWLVFVISLIILIPLSYILGLKEPLPSAFFLPDQIVLSRLSGYSTPSVYIGQPAIVKGTKCNQTRKTLHAGGVLSWTSVFPPGVVVEDKVSGGTIFLPHQCKTGTFDNFPPKEIEIKTKLLLKNNPGPILWRITGTISATGYAEQRWVTQPFAVIIP